MQPLELPLRDAIEVAPQSARLLAAMATEHRTQHTVTDICATKRAWIADAGTFCYQTHIAISAQAEDRLFWLSDVFYRAASLKVQPWYPEFLGGVAEAVSATPAFGVEQHQLCLGRFDLGVGQPRFYRQLVSLAETDEHTRVIAARSVPDGPAPAPGGKLAYTLSPNGEVFFWENDCLHWHHICCTPGAALLPPRWDRLLINTLRRLGLDSAECNTYREEAHQLRDWLQSGGELALDFVD